MPTYWWDGHANFGDALTPWLLPRYGMVPVHTVPERALLVGIGSILDQLPSTYAGTVWGSGLLHGRPVPLPHARFLAVRGYLTRQLMGLGASVALGDPGILAARHVKRPRVKWTLGVVPHGIHARSPLIEDLREREPDHVKVFDTRKSPHQVVRGIGSCDAILSTSLHGLVVADSFGIPAVWAELDPRLWGSDFKFRDYESVISPGASRRFHLRAGTRLGDVLAAVGRPHRDEVERSSSSLEEALSSVPTMENLPFLALRHR